MSQAISGDRFGPVSADYFNQRRVEKVEKGDGGQGSPEWTIFFEGGGMIHNYESEVPMPKAIVGAALTRTILDGTNKVTRLQFGLEEVTLNPVKYAIVDPTYTKGKVVYPQASDANMPIPPPADPSADRVADGPSEEFLQTQADEQAAAQADAEASE